MSRWRLSYEEEIARWLETAAGKTYQELDERTDGIECRVRSYVPLDQRFDFSNTD